MNRQAMANALKQTKPAGNGSQPLLLIRHGATKLNNDDVSVDRIRGWKDIPLSPDGREEANRLGEKLKSDRPACIVSSDLVRAAETADIIAKHLGMKVDEKTPGFRPWNVGDLAGEKTQKAIPILAKYAIEKPNEPVPGGESFHDFEARFFQALSEAIQKYGSKGKLAIVTHHRDERLMEGWRAAGFPADGEIEKAAFNRKGEPTGEVIPMTIDTKLVSAAAQEMAGMVSRQGRMRDDKAPIFSMGGAA